MRTKRTLETQLGRQPEPAEIASELEMDVDKVLDLISLGNDHVSLDAPLSEDGEVTLGDVIAQDDTPQPDESMLDKESRTQLMLLVDSLDKRSADIMKSRYGLIDGRRQTLAEVGVIHKVSAERIRQLEREALNRLRMAADRDLASS